MEQIIPSVHPCLLSENQDGVAGEGVAKRRTGKWDVSNYSLNSWDYLVSCSLRQKYYCWVLSGLGEVFLPEKPRFSCSQWGRWVSRREEISRISVRKLFLLTAHGYIKDPGGHLCAGITGINPTWNCWEREGQNTRNQEVQEFFPRAMWNLFLPLWV